jgi:cell division protein FtsB
VILLGVMGRTLNPRRFFHRPRAKTALILAVGAAALAYFGFHAINGQRGLVAWFQVGQRIELLENRWVLNQTRIDSLELAVSLLRVESLDRDMLDERARHILGLAHPEEIIILHH